MSTAEKETINWNKVLTYILTLLVGVCATGATMMFTVVSQISAVGAKIDGFEKLVELEQRQTEREFTSVWQAITELKKERKQ